MKLTLQMKKGVLLVLDALLIQLVYLLAFAIRFDYDFSGRMVSNYWPVYRENLLWILLIKLAVFYMLGLYHSLWR